MDATILLYPCVPANLWGSKHKGRLAGWLTDGARLQERKRKRGENRLEKTVMCEVAGGRGGAGGENE
jgi:hypothetical protein